MRHLKRKRIQGCMIAIFLEKVFTETKVVKYIYTESGTRSVTRFSQKFSCKFHCGWWAVQQLQCSQAREIFQDELLKINKQNLYDRPSAALCMIQSANPRPPLCATDWYRPVSGHHSPFCDLFTHLFSLPALHCIALPSKHDNHPRDR